MRRGAAELLLFGSLLVSPGFAAGAPPGVEEHVDVSRVLIDVRALDARGDALRDLGPEDFLVRVDGREVEVDSADWVEGATPDLRKLLGPERQGAERDGLAHGRLIVILFQRDLDASRMKGLMRMRDEVHRFVRGVRENDRVAVLVHDTNLKLYSDFTRDRERLGEILSRAIVYQRPPEAGEPGTPSLRARLDPRAAADAAHAEDGLLLLARALDRLPGAKTLIYVGWGLNRWEGATTTLGRALGLLIHGRVTMYSLDVTDADVHTLEAPLLQAALETGGFYQKTHVFAETAMSRVEHAMAGHYELAVFRPDLPAGRHVVEIELREAKGTAYHKRFYDD